MGDVAGSVGVLARKLVKFSASGIKRALLQFFRFEGVDERAAFPVDPVVRNLLDAFSSWRRGFIEDANDFAAERPQVIDVFLNGLRRQVRSG